MKVFDILSQQRTLSLALARASRPQASSVSLSSRARVRKPCLADLPPADTLSCLRKPSASLAGVAVLTSLASPVFLPLRRSEASRGFEGAILNFVLLSIFHGCNHVTTDCSFAERAVACPLAPLRPPISSRARVLKPRWSSPLLIEASTASSFFQIFLPLRRPEASMGVDRVDLADNKKVVFF